MPQELSDRQDRKRSKYRPFESAASRCSTKLALAHLKQQAA